jgi:hypothetical protein
MFGQDRLVSAVMRGGRRGRDLLDGLLDEVTTFSGTTSHQDDVTVLALDLGGV